jgi:hypothetical protein
MLCATCGCTAGGKQSHARVTLAEYYFRADLMLACAECAYRRAFHPGHPPHARQPCQTDVLSRVGRRLAPQHAREIQTSTHCHHALIALARLQHPAAHVLAELLQLSVFERVHPVYCSPACAIKHLTCFVPSVCGRLTPRLAHSAASGCCYLADCSHGGQ